MKKKGVRGRLTLLTCLLSCALLAPAGAQSPVATPNPAPTTATSTAPKEAPKVPVTSPGTPTETVTQAATVPSPAPSTAPATSSGRLDMPTEAEREASGQWKKKGVVGQSTFMDKLRTVTWSLAFICFVIWLIGKFASKGTLEKFGLPSEPDSLIEVLEKKRISPGRSIMVLRVGPKVLAVAVTESGFSTLTEIDSDAVKQHQDDRVVEASSEPPPLPPQRPSDVAKHYLSIIPGLGAKK